MAEDVTRMSIIVVAVVAIVAIVAVFGMVYTTGYGIGGPVIRDPVVCQKFNTECLAVLEGDSATCQKCCALNFACTHQLYGLIDHDGLMRCMDGCATGSCKQISTCSSCIRTEGCCWDNTKGCINLQPDEVCLALCDIIIDR